MPRLGKVFKKRVNVGKCKKKINSEQLEQSVKDNVTASLRERKPAEEKSSTSTRNYIPIY